MDSAGVGAVKLTHYPNPSSQDGSYSAQEVRSGFIWLHTDIECPWCHKVQPVAATGHLGGPCVRCGKLTDGTPEIIARVIGDA